MLTQSVSVVPFLGSDVAADYEAARVVILPIPYEATTTYRQGCENGPVAILEASQQVEFYDEELEEEFCSVGIYTHNLIADSRHNQRISSAEMLDVTQQTVRSLILRSEGELKP